MLSILIGFCLLTSASVVEPTLTAESPLSQIVIRRTLSQNRRTTTTTTTAVPGTTTTTTTVPGTTSTRTNNGSTNPGNGNGNGNGKQANTGDSSTGNATNPGGPRTTTVPGTTSTRTNNGNTNGNGKQANTGDSSTGNATNPGGPATILYQRDFAAGTYRIRKAGRYQLGEDIVFEPPAGPNGDYLPNKDDPNYPFQDYFLGWFAAIAIEADDVTLDLAGYTISQSFIHSLFQRFFCIVELCARPFVAGQGPPAFTALKSQPICANRLTIQNGVMGPTSHHCVHGLRNSVVKMSNIDCREFEVAGFQLNGPRDVELSNLKIGPSSQATMAKATLSHTNFLLLFAQKFLPLIQLSSLGNVNPRQMQVKLRGSMHSVGDVFDRLKQARDKYIADLVANQPSPAQTCDYDPSQIFCNPSGLPDGSALVGILVHKDNVAINSFGACSVQEDHIYAEGKGNFSDLRILKVQIADMKLKTEEILEVHNNLGKKIIGPQGDVLNLFGDFGGDSRKFFFSRALKDRFKYRGNVLLDAQVALGKVASSWTGTAADRARWFGGLFISPEIFAYAGWDITLPELFGTYNADGILEVSDSKHKVDCNLDAMGHVNKGAMGVRLEFIDNIFMKDVTVDRIRNEGLQGNYGVCDELPNWTPLKPYSGADARAMSFRYVQDGHYKKVQVNDITSQSGFACGWDMGLFTSLGAADDVEIYRVDK